MDCDVISRLFRVCNLTRVSFPAWSWFQGKANANSSTQQNGKAPYKPAAHLKSVCAVISQPQEGYLMVRQFQYLGWAGHREVPASKRSFLKLILQVDQWQREGEEGEGRTIVHCLWVFTINTLSFTIRSGMKESSLYFLHSGSFVVASCSNGWTKPTPLFFFFCLMIHLIQNQWCQHKDRKFKQFALAIISFDVLCPHCFSAYRNGGGRSGVFCASSIVCEMAKRQSVVDVFHAVKTLRNSKPNMVDTPVSSSKRDTDGVGPICVWFLRDKAIESRRWKQADKVKCIRAENQIKSCVTSLGSKYQQ